MADAGDLRFWRLVRAGGGVPNVQALGQRARSFAAAAAELGQVDLVTTRTDAGLVSWLVAPSGPAAEPVALHLAQAVAASAQPSERPPSLEAPALGWLVANDGVAVRDTQAGVDPAEMSRRLAVAMRPGSWVGMSLRPPSRSEARRSRSWYEARLGTALAQHHASSGQTVVMSCFAGGAGAAEVRALLDQVAAALPGFDVEVDVRVASPWRPVAGTGLAAIAGWAGGWAATGSPLLGSAVAATPAALCLGFGSGALRSRADRWAEVTLSGSLPSPVRRRLPPRSPARRTGRSDGEPSTLHPSAGDYPLARSSFLVGPTVVVGLVAPHAGAASGASSTESRDVPAVLTAPIGPMVGVSSGVSVFLPAADTFAGVALLGQPGSGKSVTLRNLWAWHCAERVDPTGEPGWPGARNAMVAFEAKGDGALALQAWSNAAGDPTVLVDVGDPSSWAIDLFAVPGTVVERGAWFANAMVYAFGSDAIQDRSFDTLTSVLAGGLTVTDDIASAAGELVGRSALHYAHVLLGGAGDQRGLRLATAIASAAATVGRDARASSSASAAIEPWSGDSPTPASGSESGPGGAPVSDLELAAERLAPLYGTGGGKVTEAQRRNLTEAPRNKVGQLLAAEQWWSPSRRRFSWDRVLDGHRSVVVNTGTSATGAVVDDRLTGQLSALLMFSLRAAIQRRCAGWQAEGRSVTVFADELALVAGSSAEVLTWLRNQGRSYGVRPVFATQYPEQLPHAVRTALMGFGTLIAFAQQNAQVVGEVVADLALGGDVWTPADIAGLEKFHAVVRCSVAGQRQPTVPIAAAWFEELLTSDPATAWSEMLAANRR